MGCVVQEPNYRSVVLGDNPVGYWRLDETVPPGTTATNLGSLRAGGNGTYFAGASGGRAGALVEMLTLRLGSMGWLARWKCLSTPRSTPPLTASNAGPTRARLLRLAT